MNKIVHLCFLAALTGFLTFGNTASAKEEIAFFAASDGSSTIRMLWFAPVDKWPDGGWRITDDTGRIWVQQVLPMQPENLKGLTSQQLSDLQDLLDAGSKAKKASGQERETYSGFAAMLAMTSFKQAKALGMACEIRGVPGDEQVYTLCRLDKSKKVYGPCAASKKLSGQKADPLPDGPVQLRVSPSKQGVRMFWQPSKNQRDFPVMSYVVDRICEDRQFSDQFYLTTGVSWDETQPAFIDADAPVEQTVTYNVYSLDLLGRKSAPASVRMFLNDPLSLTAPVELKAAGRPGRVEVSWKPAENGSPAAYIVERSFSRNGFYELLTPDALDRKKTSYLDRTAEKGNGYFYRVRAVGSDGKPGDPSDTVFVELADSERPDPPEGLTADVNPVRVRLTWTDTAKNSAGFHVEKKASTQTEWQRINRELVVPPVFADRFMPGISGSFSYRVTAVGKNGLSSRPSSAVQVAIETASPPPVPIIRQITGKEGRVRLAYEPGQPVDTSVTFSIVRGMSLRREGEMIKTGLSSKLTEFTDDTVIPEEEYWYAVVAADRRTGKETWSRKARVQVGVPGIKRAEEPELAFVSKPFSHVKITIRHAPEDFLVAVQRKDSTDAPWITIHRGLHRPESVVDSAPVTSRSSWYRVVYHTMAGRQGEPSRTVELMR